MVVVTVTRFRAGRPRGEFRFLTGAEGFSLLQNVQIGLETHPAAQCMNLTTHSTLIADVKTDCRCHFIPRVILRPL